MQRDESRETPSDVTAPAPIAEKSNPMHNGKPATAPRKTSAPAWRPFPLSALPEPARTFVDAASRAIGCDASYIALPLLAALAAAIGNSARIRLKRGWTEPAVIWAAIVGESGTLKSPALDAPLRPIREKQAQALKEYRDSLADFERAQNEYAAAMAEWKRKKKENRAEQPIPPAPPVCKRFWVSDTTVEALAQRLSQAPRGLLLCRDELAGWLKSFGQYKGGKGQDAAHFLTMHGARDLLVDRKTGDQTTIYVAHAALGIVGGVQPAILRMTLATEHFEDGLAARLLLAMPPRQPKRWSEMEVDDDLNRALANMFGTLYAMPLPVHAVTGEPEPATIKLSAEGKAAWVRFFNEHAQEQAELTGDLAAAWSKLEGYAARFALIVHLVRWAAGDSTLADPNAVDAQSIEAGVTLSRWFGQEAKRVYAVLSESDEEREQRQLAELIERRGGSITVRELMHASRQYRGSSADAEAALEALAKAGIVTREPVGPGEHGGQPTTRYRLIHAEQVGNNVLPTPAEVSFTLSGNGNTTQPNTKKTEVLLPLPPLPDGERPANGTPEEAEWTA
jgi:hypothetical protein